MVVGIVGVVVDVLFYGVFDGCVELVVLDGLGV